MNARRKNRKWEHGDRRQVGLEKRVMWKTDKGIWRRQNGKKRRRKCGEWEKAGTGGWRIGSREKMRRMSRRC